MARIVNSTWSMIFAIVATFLVALVTADDTTTTYSDISPQKWAISLSYRTTNGLESPIPCADFDGSTGTCNLDNQPLPAVDVTDKDSILISYKTIVPNFTNFTSTIILRACFSSYSSTDRPWRKANSNINEDFTKNCSVKITADLNITQLPGDDGGFGGEFTWIPGQASAPAFYNIQAVEVCEDGMYCAYGRGPATYEIIPINSRPDWLVALVSCLMCVGPVSLVSFIVIEKIIKKKK